MSTVKRIRPKTTKRPWGDFQEFVTNTRCTVKILTIKPGQRLSDQRHKHRSEFWRVIAGRVSVDIEMPNGRKSHRRYDRGEETWIPAGAWHRATNPASMAPAQILEISFGRFDEKDIERREDDYGRA